MVRDGFAAWRLVGANVNLAKLSNASQKLDFPAYDGEVRPYIVAAQPRSGSHLLCQLLYHTRQAGCPLEYFHKRHWDAWCQRCRKTNPNLVLSVILRRRTSPNGIFGCKMHWAQFRFFVKLGLEKRFHGAKFVYLTRDDVLGQAISHALAVQTGQWTSLHASTKKQPVYSFEAVNRSLSLILEERRMWEAFFARAGIAPLRLTYESLVGNKRDAIARLLKYLAIDYTVTDEGLESIPLAVQRTDINDEWRQRFLCAGAARYDGARHWWGLLERELACRGGDS